MLCLSRLFGCRKYVQMLIVFVVVVGFFFFFIKIIILAVKMQKSGTGPFFFQLALMVASFILIFLWQRYLIYVVL